MTLSAQLDASSIMPNVTIGGTFNKVSQSRQYDCSSTCVIDLLIWCVLCPFQLSMAYMQEKGTQIEKKVLLQTPAVQCIQSELQLLIH